MTHVTVIDYKAGNLTSVVKALRYLGAEVTVTEDPLAVAQAERIVLPGVGHFAATARLDATGLTPAIREAIARGTPFLGICVGMQWLLRGSKEAPEQPGLGHFTAWCGRFPDGRGKVPHVGWNQVQLDFDAGRPMRIMNGIKNNEFVYFTHSYFAPSDTAVLDSLEKAGPNDPSAAHTMYILPFCSVLEWKNVFGVQFHPEKSGETGLKILRNFLEIEPC
jgi:glutamine amidotransferase